MSTTAQPDDARRTEFQMTADTESSPDIWVSETYTNEYGDERAVLRGDTYDAKDIIKFDWDTTHHDYDGDRKVWIVDADALDILDVKLAAEGFDLDPGYTDEPDYSPLVDAQAAASAEDRIEVEYRQKNGNGTNTKTGAVTQSLEADDHSGPCIQLQRDDGQYMYIKCDDDGDVALYTSGSHAPFVGWVETVRLGGQT